MSHAYIYDAVRSPRGKGKSSGSLYTVRPVELLAQVLRALRDRNSLDTTQVEDVVMGCVTQTGEQGQCVARTSALLAGYDQNAAAGVTLNRFCGSGLEAVNHAACMVASGFFDLVVAGGVESMSRVKMGSDGGALLDVASQWSFGSVPQGISADLLATLRGFTRQDADEFALRSQQRATMARELGRFSRSIVPIVDESGIPYLDHDELVRPTTTLEALARLGPAFKMMGEQFSLDALTRKNYPEVERVNHIHTAGNSSGIVDGAAALLIGSKEKGAELGLTPRAIIKSVAVCGDDPLLMLDGPIPATNKALAKAGMSIRDIDLFEVNEAFATVPMCFMKEFDVDPAEVNVNGGAIALGHPLGATGAMLLNTVLDALEDADKATGLVTLCIGGGMGIATIIERV